MIWVDTCCWFESWTIRGSRSLSSPNVDDVPSISSNTVSEPTEQ
jgi:hypothetical protein